mmetsp:Transcript_47574/g.101091  ORF Transcript_47574/g.101091 Transcript_47574/m.101091 type:complete len:86 (+) Transcript_47574:3167-3424(+)
MWPWFHILQSLFNLAKHMSTNRSGNETNENANGPADEISRHFCSSNIGATDEIPDQNFSSACQAIVADDHSSQTFHAPEHLFDHR